MTVTISDKQYTPVTTFSLKIGCLPLNIYQGERVGGLQMNGIKFWNPNDTWSKGAAGAGFSSALVSSWADRAALSAEESFGTGQFFGKNWTILATRLARMNGT